MFSCDQTGCASVCDAFLCERHRVDVPSCWCPPWPPGSRGVCKALPLVASFPCPCSAFRKEVTKYSPHSRGQELSSASRSGECGHVYLEFSCKEGLPLLSLFFFFNYLFFSIWTHKSLFSTLGCSSVVLLLVLLLRLFLLWPLELLRAASVSLSHAVLLSVVCGFAFWAVSCFLASSCIFPVPVLKSAFSLKSSSCSFYWRMGFRNGALGPRCVHYFRGIIASRRSQW